MTTTPSNPYRTYALTLISLILILLGSMAAINYVTDRFKIYHKEAAVIEAKVTPNERAMKFNAYAQHCQAFNAIIFGTSRAPMYTSQIIGRQFGLNAFNFGVSAESFHGILRKLHWAVGNSCPLKTIFIPINSDQLKYMIDYSLPPYTLRRMDPPQIVAYKDYGYTFNLIYLLSLSATRSNLDYLLFESRKDTTLRYHLNTGDVEYLWDDSFEISPCPKSTIAHEEAELAEAVLTEAILTEAVGLMTAIHQLALKAKIEVVLMWNPLTRDKQLASRKILKFLGDISPLFHRIYRIPLTDPRLQQSRYYHDVGHFNEMLAREVVLPANQVEIDVLIQELKAARDQCQDQSPKEVSQITGRPAQIMNKFITNGS